MPTVTTVAVCSQCQGPLYYFSADPSVPVKHKFTVGCTVCGKVYYDGDVCADAIKTIGQNTPGNINGCVPKITAANPISISNISHHVPAATKKVEEGMWVKCIKKSYDIVVNTVCHVAEVDDSTVFAFSSRTACGWFDEKTFWDYFQELEIKVGMKVKCIKEWSCAGLHNTVGHVYEVTKLWKECVIELAGDSGYSKCSSNDFWEYFSPAEESISKTYTMMAAYNANKNQDYCVNCGKKTEEKAVFTGVVRYCSCVDSLPR